MTTRNRLIALLTVLLLALSVLAGCGSTEKKAEPVPAAASAPAAAPAPQVDKAAVVKEAVVNFFGAIPPNSNMMEPADLQKKVEAKDGTIYIVDVRKPEDFAKGHVPGSKNILINNVGKELNNLPKDKQLVIYCYSGQTSGQTVAALKIAGFNAISVKGGFPAWEKLNAPIEK